MYKFINGQLPYSVTSSSMLKRTENVHNHNLRNYNGITFNTYEQTTESLQ